ncbi:cyclase family protein [Cupriavidus basilensis]
MQLVDLTGTIDPADRDRLPEPMRGTPIANVFAPRIEYHAPNAAGKDIFCAALGCTHADLPDGEGWGSEVLLELSSHCGTHVDAPLHSGSLCEGRTSRTIDEIDLNELFLPGVVFDVREYVVPGQAITSEMLDKAQQEAGVDDVHGHAVLIRTGQERFNISDPEYFNYPGMTWESTLHLTERGVRALGTDAVGWDRPFPVMSADFKRTGNKRLLWDAHKAITVKEAFIIQKLVNLASLPARGFHVGLFPLKLARCSAAPARVIGFVPN